MKQEVAGELGEYLEMLDAFLSTAEGREVTYET